MTLVRIHLIALCLAGFASAAQPCPPQCPTRVMSINLANVSDARRIADEIKQRAGTIPDILMLQEVAKPKGANTSVAEDLAKLLGLHAIFAAPKPGPTNIGIAILSRWPLSDRKVHTVPRFYRVLKIRPRVALGATTHAPSGPIRIWTTHLDTRINVQERLTQLSPILTEAQQHRGPAIIGGDLNTLGVGWVLHALPYKTGDAHARAVIDLMSRHGFQTPFTKYRPTFDRFGLQLDWIFLRGLNTVATGIEPLAFSDHHAIWTDIVLDTPRSAAQRAATYIQALNSPVAVSTRATTRR